MSRNTLAPTDNAPIRARELRRAKDLFRESDRLDTGLARFETIDRPRFVLWFEEQFGEMRRTEALRRREFERLAVAYDQVLALAHLEDLSMRAAYRRWRDEEKRLAKASPVEREEIERARRVRETCFSEIPYENPEENDDLEDEGALDADIEEPAEDRSPEVSAASGMAPAARDEDRLARVQILYRLVVRRIHPDARGPELRAKDAAWFDRIWTRAVRAREDVDLEQLEVLHGRILLTDRTLDILDLAELRQLNTALENIHARRLRETHGVRSDPGWDFSRRKKKGELHATLAAEHQKTRHRLERQIERLLAIRRSWSGKGERTSED